MTVKKYTKKEKTAALKRLKAGESVAAVARDMNIPRTTLIGWRKNSEATGARARKKTTQAREKTSTPSTGEKESEEVKEPLGLDSSADDSLNEKKKQFSRDSWQNIEKAQEIIYRRLTRALDQESAIDEIVNIILSAKDEDLTYEQKQALLNKMRKIKVEDVRELAVVVGTLYDKQALANKDVTSVVGGGVIVEFDIPRPPKKEENEG